MSQHPRKRKENLQNYLPFIFQKEICCRVYVKGAGGASCRNGFFITSKRRGIKTGFRRSVQTWGSPKISSWTPWGVFGTRFVVTSQSHVISRSKVDPARITYWVLYTPSKQTKYCTGLTDKLPISTVLYICMLFLYKAYYFILFFEAKKILGLLHHSQRWFQPPEAAQRQGGSTWLGRLAAGRSVV